MCECWRLGRHYSGGPQLRETEPGAAPGPPGAVGRRAEAGMSLPPAVEGLSSAGPPGAGRSCHARSGTLENPLAPLKAIDRCTTKNITTGVICTFTPRPAESRSPLDHHESPSYKPHRYCPTPVNWAEVNILI